MKILACQLLDQLDGSSLRPEQKWYIVLGWHAMWIPGVLPKGTPATMEKWLLQLVGLVLQSFRQVYVVVDT